VLGAAGLLISLFLPWSHQFSPAVLARFGSSTVLTGVPRDPTAWQLFGAVDVLFALLAAGLIAVALAGGRIAHALALLATGLALAFTIHALAHPPTNHAYFFEPGGPANSPTSAAGETVALGALVLALAGLALSFTADLRS
jgi:hypothetical protein